MNISLSCITATTPYFSKELISPKFIVITAIALIILSVFSVLYLHYYAKKIDNVVCKKIDAQIEEVLLRENAQALILSPIKSEFPGKASMLKVISSDFHEVKTPPQVAIEEPKIPPVSSQKLNNPEDIPLNNINNTMDKTDNMSSFSKKDEEMLLDLPKKVYEKLFAFYINNSDHEETLAILREMHEKKIEAKYEILYQQALSFYFENDDKAGCLAFLKQILEKQINVDTHLYYQITNRYIFSL